MQPPNLLLLFRSFPCQKLSPRVQPIRYVTNPYNKLGPQNRSSNFSSQIDFFKSTKVNSIPSLLSSLSQKWACWENLTLFFPLKKLPFQVSLLSLLSSLSSLSSFTGLSIYYLVVSASPTLPWTVCHESLAEPGRSAA